MDTEVKILRIVNWRSAALAGSEDSWKSWNHTFPNLFDTKAWPLEEC